MFKWIFHFKSILVSKMSLLSGWWRSLCTMCLLIFVPIYTYKYISLSAETTFIFLVFSLFIYLFIACHPSWTILTWCFACLSHFTVGWVHMIKFFPFLQLVGVCVHARVCVRASTPAHRLFRECFMFIIQRSCLKSRRSIKYAYCWIQLIAKYKSSLVLY